MDRFRELIEEHKVAAIMLAFVLVIFIGFSVLRAMDVAQQRELEEAQQQKEQQQDKETEEEEIVHLSESQQELIEGYDAKTITLIKTLSRGVWSANNGKNTVVFHENYFTETEGTEVTNRPYAVSAVEYGNNGEDTEVDVIALDTDEGIHLVTYTSVKSAESKDAGTSTLASSTLFSLKDAPYSRADTVTEIEVTGLNKEVTELLGNRKDLVAEMSEWCSVHYPATTTAAWIGTATIDWNEEIVVTSFSLGSEEGETGDGTGTAATVISVTYNSSTGEYEFSS